MTHLDPTEFHAHRTSCLSGGEFPCHATLVPEPYDPIWDEGCDPMVLITKWRANHRKCLPLE